MWRVGRELDGVGMPPSAGLRLYVPRWFWGLGGFDARGWTNFSDGGNKSNVNASWETLREMKTPAPGIEICGCVFSTF